MRIKNARSWNVMSSMGAMKIDVLLKSSLDAPSACIRRRRRRTS
jgi:hypothetical protein